MDYYSGVTYNSQKKLEWTENTYTSNGSHQITFSLLLHFIKKQEDN